MLEVALQNPLYKNLLISPKFFEGHLLYIPFLEVPGIIITYGLLITFCLISFAGHVDHENQRSKECELKTYFLLQVHH